MKVIVVFKWSRNPEDARVGVDGSMNWQGVKMAPSDDDPTAMEIACSIADGGEVIGLTVGDGDASWAAARGAARTVTVTDVHQDVNSSVTGAILAAAIRRIEGVDAVLIGDSAWDYGVVSALAGQLGWHALAGVVSATTEQDGLHVTRKMGSALQVLEVKGPAVLAVSASRAEKKLPGMKEVLAARKKPVEKLTMADLGLMSESNVNSRGTRFPDTPSAQIIDGSDPVTACSQLMTALRADGVL
jgi:electron transfer flavoprotein beta subunit